MAGFRLKAPDMTRKDAARPLVRCSECRSFATWTNYCTVARKLFVLNKASTCRRFAPKPKAPATNRPEPDQHRAPVPPWTLPELRVVLELEDLADAVEELRVDAAGAIWIRYASGADLATMNAVAALVHDAGREGSR